MTTIPNVRSVKSATQLARCRRQIDRLPLRQQPKLLHEFEETETRLSAIAKANVAAQTALAEQAATVEFEHALTPAAPDFSACLRSLQRCRDTLSKQLKQIESVAR